MNIAEILKYFPKGTKLYSLADGEVTLESIRNTGQYNIKVVANNGNISYFTKDGKIFADRPNGECILFPSKNQRNWDEFRLPVKRGDIMMSNGKAFIISDTVMGAYHEYICGIDTTGAFKVSNSNHHHWTTSFYIPASEEAKKELFDKMKEAGYRWNADTLELEKIESEFKEGDVVVDNSGSLCLVSKVENYYNFIVVSAVLCTDGLLTISDNSTIKRNIKMITLAPIKNRNKLFSALAKEGYKYDKWQHKLIKQKFKPFDKVLVRNKPNEKWLINIFSHYDNENKDYPYVCLLNGHYSYCVPYEGNEYLVDKND